MNGKRPKLVVLSGAGISAESGVKTFRDSGGLWENYPVEEVASIEAWAWNKAVMLRFYNERRAQLKTVQPNAAHLGLAALEQDYDVRIITQNVDDLHERAGSTKVLHLHGELKKMRSEHHPHDDRYALPIEGDIALGQKAPDGGQLRPHIVWFGEAVPAIETAATWISDADIVVVVGTSLQVYPAAGLIDVAPPAAKIFVIDRNVPFVRRNVTAIEKPATEGVQELMQLLND